jgi:transcription initiation factor TFIID subunit TAF12
MGLSTVQPVCRFVRNLPAERQSSRLPEVARKSQFVKFSDRFSFQLQQQQQQQQQPFKLSFMHSMHVKRMDIFIICSGSFPVLSAATTRTKRNPKTLVNAARNNLYRGQRQASVEYSRIACAVRAARLPATAIAGVRPLTLSRGVLTACSAQPDFESDKACTLVYII